MRSHGHLQAMKETVKEQSNAGHNVLTYMLGSIEAMAGSRARASSRRAYRASHQSIRLLWLSSGRGNDTSVA